jgi:hypothetical protein
MKFDPNAILADAEIVASLASIAVKLGEEVAPYVEQLYDIIVKKESLSAAQREASIAAEAALRTRLNAPQPGDPDYTEGE